MIFITEKNTKKLPGVTSLFVDFKYNAQIVEIMKNCVPHHYDKKTKLWEIPIFCLSKIVNLCTKIDDVQLDLLPDYTPIEKTSYKLCKYKTTPYLHQIEAIKYGLNNNSWLLLDQPGLGKTLSTIYLAQELKKRDKLQHCLIICGVNTLKTNWEREINTHSDLTCKILGKKTTKTGNVIYTSIADRIKELKSNLPQFFIIINIEMLRSDEIVKQLKSGINKFDIIILDEAHCCKNPQSQQTHALLKLTNAKYKIALTGTPILNTPLDSYAPLKWIGQEKSNFSTFKSQYCIYGGPFGNEIIGYKNVEILQEQLNNCSLRRTKELLDLPPKTIINEVLDMSEKQQNFYTNIVNGIIDEIDKVELNTTNLLSMITRLRQATACPSILTTESVPSVKIDRCCELAQEIVQNREKVVIFSLFKPTLDVIYNKLEQYSPLLCTGDISDEIIANNITKFQTNEENKIILCTHSKMGTGVTLNRASYAIFVDCPWTYGSNEQSEDRIHRIGSKNSVFIYKLFCNDTFDLKVRQIIENKEAIGEYIVDNKRDLKTLQILKNLIQDIRPNIN